MLFNILGLLLVQMVFLFQQTSTFAITTGNCQKNISIKYQVPVTKTRLNRHHHFQQHPSHPSPPSHPNGNYNPNMLLPYTETEHYVEYEERIRWDTVSICCPGYRTILFGLCEPICTAGCQAHAYCAEPNKCQCSRGYEPSHRHLSRRDQPVYCRPTCAGGCPQHSHCVAHNKCECRAGYRDVSAWLSPLRCERIQCGAEQRYDVPSKMCVKIEMTMEELMQKVAERLSKGLDSSDITETYELDYDSSPQSWEV